MKKLFLLLSFCFISSVSGYEYDPIAVYLTWKRNPETTMCVQWVTEKNRKTSAVQYRRMGETEWKSRAGDYQPMPHAHPYYIHHVELITLTPDTTYEFKTGLDGKIYQFHTMSDDKEKPIRFVVGGDVYHGDLELMEPTNRQAAAQNPMFALIGGDIAYAAPRRGDKDREKEKRWLEFLVSWKNTMITPEGNLIPIIPAIGNEDTEGKYDQTPESSPFFYALFPFPGKQGYNVLDFGTFMSVVILDTGHTHPINGKQKEWLYKTLEERKNIPHKFALYHVPAWPCFRKTREKMSPLVRLHWVPIFEKFALAAAFEHHDHSYKRTPLIYQGAENKEKGVLYIGDGAWGVKKVREPKMADSRWFLEVTAQEKHFILVTVNKLERSYKAITPEGRVFDAFLHTSF